MKFRYCESKFVPILFFICMNQILVYGKQWLKERIPNPLIDLGSCGRDGKASYVCDPDNFLSLKAADFIDDVIYNISSPTLSEYNDNGDLIRLRHFEIVLVVLEGLNYEEYGSGNEYIKVVSKYINDNWV